MDIYLLNALPVIKPTVYVS